MTRALFRPATRIRIYCPVGDATLDAFRASNWAVMEADETLAAMLAILRDANPLGDFGLYKGVAEISAGVETFIPTADAQPTAGDAGSVAMSATLILTSYVAADCSHDQLATLVGQLCDAHPWEIPVIEVCPVQLAVRKNHIKTLV